MFLTVFTKEFKDSFFELIIINAAIIVTSIILGLSIMVENLAFQTIAIFLFSGAMMGSIFIFINYVVKAFHSKLYTNEGYLTFTLPLSIHQILLPRILVYTLWTIILFTSYSIAMTIIIMFTADIDVFLKIVADLIGALNVPAEAAFALVSLTFVNVLVFIIESLFLLNVILALLNLLRVKRAKLLLSVLFIVLLQSFRTLVLDPIGKLLPNVNYDFATRKITVSTQPINLGESVSFFSFGYVLLSVLVIGVCYLITHYILKNKLDLEA